MNYKEKLVAKALNVMLLFLVIYLFLAIIFSNYFASKIEATKSLGIHPIVAQLNFDKRLYNEYSAYYELQLRFPRSQLDNEKEWEQFFGG